MKIGIDASRAFVSQKTGTENYSYQLIKAIAKTDRKNRYTLYTRKIDKQNRSNFELKHISLPFLWTQLGLALETFLHPPNVLFVPSHTLPVIRPPGLKTVVTIHDLGYEYLPQYHRFPQKLYLNKSTEFAVKHSTRLIAVSEATKKDLINKLGCPEEKITVVYEGFDREKFSILNSQFSNKSPKSLKVNRPYFLFVGTLQPRKNIVRLIEAFSKLTHYTMVRNHPDKHSAANSGIDLVLAGAKGWLYDDILAAPKKFGVPDRVKFLGYQSDENLAVLYSGALCLCLPSLFEGFGLPVLEAMACGCPVVVSKTSSLPEVAGNAGLYVDPCDVDDIASKLKLIMENRKMRMEMGEKGLKQAAKFSWEKAARETIEILERTGRPHALDMS